MNKYQTRRAVVSLFFAGYAIGGLAIANNALTGITAALTAIPETGLLAGSSEEFFLNLAGLVGGGALFGASLVIALGLGYWATKK